MNGLPGIAASNGSVNTSFFKDSNSVLRSDVVEWSAEPDSIASVRDRPNVDALRQFAVGAALPVAVARDASLADTGDPVARMTLGAKVTNSVANGIASAARDTGGALGAFLRDPKNDALLAGGAGTLLAVQAAPGLDVGADAVLGVIGVAMYASAGPEHRENISKALGKLKDYAAEVTGAKSQAELGKASQDFANFLKIGGQETADALGAIAGAAAAPTKLFGLAKQVQELGGIDGIIAAGSKNLGSVYDGTNSVAGGVGRGLDAAGALLDELAAKTGSLFEPQLATNGPSIKLAVPSDAKHIYESRAVSDAAGARRDIVAHEAAGGHSIDRHVGKSDNWLSNRLANNPRLDVASTFTNEAAANRAQGRFVKQNQGKISLWLADSAKSTTMADTIDMGNPIGRILERGESKSAPTAKAELVLIRDQSAQGWHFRTSFPVK